MSKQTPLWDDHIKLGATMVDFAGYNMPVRYKEGIIEEHLWTRNNCGIFDVSHMGQVIFTGENITQVFSKLTPTDFSKIKDHTCKYTVLLSENGGIFDDLIVTKFSHNEFFVVWNASRKHENMMHVLSHFPSTQHKILQNRGLIAVQGPRSGDVISRIFPESESLGYMKGIRFQSHKYGDIIITRTGYTGERGFEISIDGAHAHTLWNELLHNDLCRPVGLGARDSLRLEVGYPLYGNDLDLNTDPISAQLSFVMTKGHNGYLGYKRIDDILTSGPTKRRSGIILQDRGVLRHGYKVFHKGREIGILTSGGHSPVLGKSIGLAYLPANLNIGENVQVEIRGKLLEAQIAELPFIVTQPR